MRTSFNSPPAIVRIFPEDGGYDMRKRWVTSGIIQPPTGEDPYLILVSEEVLTQLDQQTEDDLADVIAGPPKFLKCRDIAASKDVRHVFHIGPGLRDTGLDDECIGLARLKTGEGECSSCAARHGDHRYSPPPFAMKLVEQAGRNLGRAR